MTPSFILVTDLSACHPDWPAAAAQADALAKSMAPQIGFTPVVRLASQRLASPSSPGFNSPAADTHFDLPAVLADEAAANRRAIFLIPAILDFGVLRKAQLAEAAAEARHQFPYAVIAYDDVDPCHPLLVEAWTQRVYQRLARSSWKPEQVGLLVTSRGDGGSAGRASSYRLMRLLWEQVGCARGDVAFCRHARLYGRLPGRKYRFRCDGQTDCSSVFGLWCGAFCPLALMESADPRLIPPVSFSLCRAFRLGGSRSDLGAITPCRTLRNLSAATS